MVRRAYADDVAAIDEICRTGASKGKAESPRALPWGDQRRDGYFVAVGEGKVRAVARLQEMMTTDGKVLKFEPFLAMDDESEAALTGWLVEEGKESGASAVNIWCVNDSAMKLRDIGFQQVREFWRMDRTHLRGLPDVVTAEPVTLINAADPLAQMSEWVAAYNEAFDGEWQHWPETERSWTNWVKANPRLALAAIDRSGGVAGVTLGRIEWFSADSRRQPVGHPLVVGVVPPKRRKRIAKALLVALLKEFAFEDALSGSIRTDTESEFESRRIYEDLGFTRALSFYVYERRLSNRGGGS